jgi:two-component system, chemotaxis family, protein-glutamate methylesterase/glutaminase
LGKRNIIVIGASAGGFEAIKQLVAELPADFDAAIFIVWHMSPDVTGILPQVINRQKTLLATNAIDSEPIVNNRIYVAPPDKHLLLEKDIVRVARGPKENRFRPAVDPLFRSAAYIYGSRVIGIILSGALDDGTSGLWTIKSRGGIAIVQEPSEAEVPSMPESALAAVEVDYRLPVAEIASLLVKLTAETVEDDKEIAMEEQKKTAIEVRIAAEGQALEHGMVDIGMLTPYACPECHGVLSAIKEGDILRYRCHTGHAYSADSLLTSITENIEDTLWSAIRGVEESIILLNNLGDHYAERNQPNLAAMYFKKAKEAENRAKVVRQTVFNHEQLTANSISKQAEEDSREEGADI